MFTLCAAVALAYLFYKWVWSHYDYFEKRGVAHSKPAFLFGSYINMVYDKMSLAEVTEKWYKELRNEKYELRQPLKLKDQKNHFDFQDLGALRIPEAGLHRPLPKAHQKALSERF
jgi:hypothetical protein